jgi:type I restriction enzyme, R subunit
MSFNEMNTIENALRNHLCGRQKDEGGRMNEVREDSAPYGSSFIPHNSSLRYEYVHGDNLALYGKQPQDVFVDTFVNIKTSEVSYV